MPDTVFNSLMILGPTAAGKTRLAALLANQLDGEIISADSRQVYRGMDIGSGKDLADYFVDGKQIPCHCIDVADPRDEFNLFSWQQEVYKVFPQILRRNRLPVFCGGTGLYLDSIVRRYDLPEVPRNDALRAELAHKSMEELQQYLLNLKNEHVQDDLYDRRRLLRSIEIAVYKNGQGGCCCGNTGTAIRPFVLGIRFNRSDLRRRIEKRLRERLDNGLIEEVQTLLDSGVSRERLERFGLEYRFVSEYIHGVIPSRADLFDRLFIAIRQFAKRQDTWFRGMERKGAAIVWLDVSETDAGTMFGRSLQLLPPYWNNTESTL